MSSIILSMCAWSSQHVIGFIETLDEPAGVRGGQVFPFVRINALQSKLTCSREHRVPPTLSIETEKRGIEEDVEAADLCPNDRLSGIRIEAAREDSKPREGLALLCREMP